MRILDLWDFCEIHRKEKPQKADFLYCNAHIYYSNGVYKFYSYKTLMFILDFDRNTLKKMSDVETITTLQHLRKFFDMFSNRQDYYNFRKLKKGDFLHL